MPRVDETFTSRSRQSLIKAIGNIRSSLEEFADAGLISVAEVLPALSRIETSVSLDVAANADLVIEALPEDMDLKRETFAALDALCRPDAILATASGHPASAIHAGVAGPESLGRSR